MQHFEPHMNQKLTVKLFKQAISKLDSNIETLTLESLCDLITEYKIGGYGQLILGPYLES